MAVFKCKMCGGNLEVSESQSYGTCDSCGSTMTLPKVDNERIVNLFNRANHYRRQNEFDKALATYESILMESSENAEAHWGCVLSRYGIEYVEDSGTHERTPTCHRVQNESIFADLDYQNAIKYAPDAHSADLYKSEAEKISEIQKGILNIARSEKPYDIFICYKEADESGRRTVDSTLAQDIYYQLTNEGYKVFFSRITLEDKLGQEYEPYIFAALNSAKVMLVVGTKQEFFNAVWVKNEWARFLEITKKDRNKLIVPCYRDMDAYDLPDELSMFQSQDMGKIGFVQDLIRGISKVLSTKKEVPSATVVQQAHDYTAEAEALLKRAFMFLEEAEWKKADELLEKVLNINPEDAQAYLGKLLIDARVNKEENLANRAVKLSEYPSYNKVLRFANEELRRRLENYNDSSTKKYEILEREKERKNREKQDLHNKKIALRQKLETTVKEIFAEVKKTRLLFVIVLLVLSVIDFIGYISTFELIPFYVPTCIALFLLAILGITFAGVCGSVGNKDKLYINTKLRGQTNEINEIYDIEKLATDYRNKIIPRVKKLGLSFVAIMIIIPIIFTASDSIKKNKYYNFCEDMTSLEYVSKLLEENTSPEELERLTFGEASQYTYNTSWTEYYLDKHYDFDFYYEDSVMKSISAPVKLFFDNIESTSSISTLVNNIEKEYSDVKYNSKENQCYFLINNSVVELPYFEDYKQSIGEDARFYIYLNMDNAYSNGYDADLEKIQSENEKRQIVLSDNNKVKICDAYGDTVLDTVCFTGAEIIEKNGSYAIKFTISNRGKTLFEQYTASNIGKGLVLKIGTTRLAEFFISTTVNTNTFTTPPNYDKSSAQDIANRANEYFRYANN